MGKLPNYTNRIAKFEENDGDGGVKFVSSVVRDAPMLSSADIGHDLRLARGSLIVQLPSLQPTQWRVQCADAASELSGLSLKTQQKPSSCGNLL